MKCNNCGNEQDHGKFCGKCGAPMTEQVEQSLQQEQKESTVLQEQQTQNQQQNTNAQNETMDKVKQHSKQYWGYFIHYLKHPTTVLDHTNETKNGLISIVIFALLLTILVTSFLNSIMDGIGISDYYSTNPSVGTVLSYLIAFLVSVFVAITTLFLINSLFGKKYSYKQMIAIFGGFLSLPIILNVVALVFLLIHSYVFFGISILIAYLLVLCLIPLYIITVLLHNNSDRLDSYYGYLIFYLAYIIINAILFTILADSILGDLLNAFENIFDYVPF